MCQIRQCENGDIPRLFELFKSVYRFNPRMQERDYFDWQFKYTPFRDKDEYTFMVLWEGEDIKGFLGYVPAQFRSEDNIHTGCWTYNWFSSDKGAGGLRLLSALMEAYDNIFLFDYTEDARRIFEIYQIPMRNLPRWLVIIDPGRVSDLFKITDSRDQKKFDESRKRLIHINSDSQGIYPCGRFDAGEEFTFGDRKNIKFYVRRTGSYLNWRYVDIPRHDYRIIRGEDKQFAVYRIEKIKGYKDGVMRILEWNFHGDAARKAMSFIVQEGIRHRSVLVDFFCTAQEMGEELAELGFFAEDTLHSKIPFLFRPINYKEGIGVAIDIPPRRQKRNLNFAEWYITKGDSDIDRIKL